MTWLQRLNMLLKAKPPAIGFMEWVRSLIDFSREAATALDAEGPAATTKEERTVLFTQLITITRRMGWKLAMESDDGTNPEVRGFIIGTDAFLDDYADLDGLEVYGNESKEKRQ